MIERPVKHTYFINNELNRIKQIVNSMPIYFEVDSKRHFSILCVSDAKESINEL